jgi:hypothetical protein
MGRTGTRTTGRAGGSARREYERRRKIREQLVRDRHPRIGGLLLALRDQPRSERSWAIGAAGEEAVALALEARCAESVCLLHDRRIPGSRANIDHLAVTATGVWVIDSKKYRGKVEVRRPLFGDPRLMINRRDRSKLADGLARQVAAVAAAVDPDVTVRGAFCLVDAELPLLRTLTFRGYPLLGRRKLAKALNAPGALSDPEVRTLAAFLAGRFRAA